VVHYTGSDVLKFLTEAYCAGRLETPD